MDLKHHLLILPVPQVDNLVQLAILFIAALNSLYCLMNYTYLHALGESNITKGTTASNLLSHMPGD